MVLCRVVEGFLSIVYGDIVCVVYDSGFNSVFEGVVEGNDGFSIFGEDRCLNMDENDVGRD